MFVLGLSRTKYILLIVLLSVGCFIISIDGQFVFDDSEAIVNNKDVKLTTPIGELFYNDFWGTRMNHSQSHKSYRPITILSFRLVIFFLYLCLYVYVFFYFRSYNCYFKASVYIYKSINEKEEDL